MNKTFLTVLVIVLVVGVLTQQSDAILRAGKRDRLEKLQRDSEMQQRETADMDTVPWCTLPGKEVKTNPSGVEGGTLLYNLYRHVRRPQGVLGRCLGFGVPLPV